MPPQLLVGQARMPLLGSAGASRRLAQAGPLQPGSHAQACCKHKPFKEQEASSVQAELERDKKAASTAVVVRRANEIISQRRERKQERRGEEKGRKRGEREKRKGERMVFPYLRTIIRGEREEKEERERKKGGG